MVCYTGFVCVGVEGNRNDIILTNGKEKTMKLRPIKANMTELSVGNTTILFSYKTPVACHKDGKWYRTAKKWSQTTTRHINQWLEGSAEEKSQEWFDQLTEGEV